MNNVIAFPSRGTGGAAHPTRMKAQALACLETHARLLAFWRDEMLASAPDDIVLLEDLEHHRLWLTDRLEVWRERM